MVTILKKFVSWIVLVLVILFCFQNMDPLSTPVRFQMNFFLPGQVYLTPSFPVIFLLGLFFLMGMLAAGFFGFYEKLARQLDIRKRDRRIRALEQEVAQLQTQLDAAAAKPPAGAEHAAGSAGSVGPTSAVLPLEENPTL